MTWRRCKNGFLPFLCECLCEGHEPRADRVMSAPPSLELAGSGAIACPSAAGAFSSDTSIASSLPCEKENDAWE